MQNIRVSLDTLKIKGARLCEFKSATGTPTQYVCIPVSECFVPRDTPRPYLMVSLIHCPNAKYGDFMIKPYVSQEDYQVMSKEEQFNLPIIGKGTFMREAPNKALSAAAESVEVADVQTVANLSAPADNGSAADVQVAPSPTEGGPTLAFPAVEYYECYTDKGWVTDFPSFEAARQFSAEDQLNRFMIYFKRDNQLVKRWRYSPETMSWSEF